MVQYTLAQCPEVIFTVSGKDSEKARYKVTKQIIELINTNKLLFRLPEGFSPRQLIEIKEQDFMAKGEDEITQSVKILNKLAISKLKVQELHDQALQVRKRIDILFTDKVVSKGDIERLQKDLKVLKDFAQANLRYKEALSEAEQARDVLDEALKTPKN
jgi:hypothetical protein